MRKQKVQKLVERLYDRADSGNPPWEPGVIDDVFDTTFPKFTVRVRREADRDDYSYRIEIVNASGVVIEEIDEADLSNYVEVAGRQMLETIWEGARRQSMGVDAALDTLLNALK